MTEETSPRAGDPADAQPAQPVEAHPYSQAPAPAELGTNHGAGAPPAPAAAWPPPADQSAAGIATDTGVLTDPWGPEPTHYPFGFAGTGAEPEPPATKRRGRSRTAVIAASGALVALIAGTAGGVVGYTIADGDSSDAVVAAPSTSATQASTPADGSIAAIAAAVTPAVVNIEASKQGGSATGSGFVISSDGYIVTNNHVIDGATNIKVMFSDGTSATADLVGRNSDYDLAVLKVDKSGLPVVKLGSSDNVRVGDSAIAVGSPLGLSGTVTSGIISALDRPVTAGTQDETSFINAIQTDAAINPGNSGGPLLNASGEVIGVNSAIATLGGSPLGGTESGSIGVGFAIPIDTANRIAQEIIKTGSAQTPVLGISVEDSDQGATVGQVTSGGPAEKAGVQQGDVITAVDGKPVADSTALIVNVRDHAVGDTVTLTIQRGGSEHQIDVVLGAAPTS